MVVCDRPFDDLPRVHLPADDLGATATIYVALDPLGDQPLVLRDGRRAAITDAQGKIVFATFDDGSHRVPQGFEWFTYHFLEDIYEVTGTVEMIGGTLAIRDAIAQPVVRLAPEVLDGVLAGAWEGTLSKRIGPNQYDGATRVPIRVAFTGYQDGHNKIPVWQPTDAQLTYSLAATGTITNATAAITLADGTCIPALSTLGTASPITEIGAAVTVLRMPAMHVPGDYQLVENGGMGSILPTHPAAFIQDAARAEFTSTTVYPHGSPNGMHLDDFHAVTTGGASCMP